MKSLLVIMLTFVMVGCAAPEKVVVTEYQNVIVTAPKALLKRCKIEPPPAKAKYLAATVEQQRDMLADILGKNMVHTKDCNDGWDVLDRWQDSVLEQYADDPKAAFDGQSPKPAAK